MFIRISHDLWPFHISRDHTIYMLEHTRRFDAVAKQYRRSRRRWYGGCCRLYSDVLLVKAPVLFLALDDTYDDVGDRH